MFDRANWMGDHRQQLGDKKLRELVLAASHDSAQYDSGVALQAQTLTIGQQLAAGIRWFDLRVGYADGKLKIHHERFYGVDFATVLDDVGNFMASHHELVLLKISHFRDFNAERFRSALLLIVNRLGPYLVTGALDNRVAATPISRFIGRNAGAVLVFVDNNDDSDATKAEFDFDPTLRTYKVLRRYRDWYAPIRRTATSPSSTSTATRRPSRPWFVGRTTMPIERMRSRATAAVFPRGSSRSTASSTASAASRMQPARTCRATCFCCRGRSPSAAARR
ncbi:MAG: hypothetical protein JO315_10515 [Acidobacteria bacterium]|nr:hypothetical protein [Acidobacteriota bacterium]